MTSQANTLCICQYISNTINNSGRELIISEELGDFDIYEFVKINYQLQYLHVDRSYTIPIYQIFSEYIASRRKKEGLTDCIVLYEILNNKVSDSTQKIKINEDVDEKYARVIFDFAKENDMTVEQNNKFDISKKRLGLRVLLCLFLMLPHVIRAELYSINSTNIKDENTGYFVFFMRDREDHLNKLLEKLENCVPLTMYKPNVNLPGTININTLCSTLYIFSAYIKISVSMLKLSFKRNSFNNELEKEIEREFSFHIPMTINYIVGNCFTMTNVRSLWYFLIYKKVIKDYQPEGVIVGGLTMSCKAALVAGENVKSDTYYLPHSITYPFHPTPPSDSTFFLTEDVKSKYWQHRIANSELEEENLISVGRLDLTPNNIGGNSNQINTEEYDVSILLATQPYDDNVRRVFVASILDGIELSSLNINVEIKVHPAESAEFYSDYAVSRILESDLDRAIDRADLVCTINSNVGVIAMAYETPVISINTQSWRYSPPLYSISGPVPMLKNTKEVAEFFEKVTENGIKDYKHEHHEFFKRFYSFSDGVNKVVSELDNK